MNRRGVLRTTCLAMGACLLIRPNHGSANDAQSGGGELPPAMRFSGPADGANVIREHIAAMARAMPNAPVIREFPKDLAALEIHSPHPVYDVVLAAAERGGWRTSVPLRGFRYLLGPMRSLKAVAVVAEDASTQRLRVISIGENNAYLQDNADAFRHLSELPQVKGGSFEVRFLSAAPAARAVWLRTQTGEGDLFYTIHPVRSGLSGKKLYTADEFEQALQTAFRRLPRNNESRPVGPPRGN